MILACNMSDYRNRPTLTFGGLDLSTDSSGNVFAGGFGGIATINTLRSCG